MKASARLGAVRAAPQRSLPSLLGPERPGKRSKDREMAVFFEGARGRAGEWCVFPKEIAAPQRKIWVMGTLKISTPNYLRD